MTHTAGKDTGLPEDLFRPVIFHNIAPEWRLECMLDCYGVVILAGKSPSRPAPEVYEPGETPTPVQAICWDARDNRFILIANVGKENLLRVNLSGHGNYIVVRRNRLGKDITSLEPWLDLCLLDVMTALGEYSEGWHAFVDAVPIKFFEALSKAQQADHLHASLYKNIVRLKLNRCMKEINGNIDAWDGQHVSGWLKAKDNSYPLRFDLYYNDKLTVRTVADIYRNDLKEAGIGNGRHAFNLEVQTTPGIFHLFEARSIIDGKVVTYKFFANSKYESAKYTGTFDDYFPYITGCAIDENNPQHYFIARLYLDDIFYTHFTNIGNRFNISSMLPFLENKKHSLIMIFPDGTASKPGYMSPLLKYDKQPVCLDILRKPITIIVQDDNDIDAMRDCLKRLKQYSPANASICIVNSSLDFGELTELVARLDVGDRCRILRIPGGKNPMFPLQKAVNDTNPDDILILSVKIQTEPRWVEHLLLASASRCNVAAVSAMTSNGGGLEALDCPCEAFSDGEFPKWLPARVFTRASLGIWPEAPICGSDCVFISRQALNECGGLDFESFSSWDSVVQDFCLRATRFGWRNIIDDRTCLHYVGGRNSASSSQDLRIITARYPEYYEYLLRAFKNSPQFLLPRMRARLGLKLFKSLERIRVLFVVAANDGGTRITEEHLVMNMQLEVECYRLACDGKTMTLHRWSGEKMEIIDKHNLSTFMEPSLHTSEEYDRVAARWMLDIDPDIVHIFHLFWHSLGVIDICRALGVKTVHTFHDFYALSPNHFLLDDTGTFMGSDFRKGASNYPVESWSGIKLPIDSQSFIAFWRNRMEDYLAKCNVFTTPSPEISRLYQDNMSSLESSHFVTIPHGRTFQGMLQLGCMPRASEKIRIVLPNCTSPYKGWFIANALLDYDQARGGNRLEFHLLGNGKLVKPRPGLVLHGRYTQEDLAAKIADIKPHAGAVFSVCCETWCHTLTELWRCGIPAFVFDLGAPMERMRRSGAGWILRLGDIPDIYKQMFAVLSDRRELSRAQTSVISWQEGEGGAGTGRKMGLDYYELYLRILSDGITSPAIPRVAIVTGDNTQSTHLKRLFANKRHRKFIFQFMRMEEFLAAAHQGYLHLAIIADTHLPEFLSQHLASLSNVSGLPYMVITSGPKDSGEKASALFENSVCIWSLSELADQNEEQLDSEIAKYFLREICPFPAYVQNPGQTFIGKD